METNSTPTRTPDTTPLQIAPALVSTANAAKTLGVSERFVRMLAARGELRIVKLGARRLVPTSEIARLVVEGAR